MSFILIVTREEICILVRLSCLVANPEPDYLSHQCEAPLCSIPRVSTIRHCTCSLVLRPVNICQDTPNSVVANAVRFCQMGGEIVEYPIKVFGCLQIRSLSRLDEPTKFCLLVHDESPIFQNLQVSIQALAPCSDDSTSRPIFP